MIRPLSSTNAAERGTEEGQRVQLRLRFVANVEFCSAFWNIVSIGVARFETFGDRERLNVEKG